MPVTYTIQQVAEILNCGEKTVRSLISSGRLPAINLRPKSSRGSWRISGESLGLLLGEAA